MGGRQSGSAVGVAERWLVTRRLSPPVPKPWRWPCSSPYAARRSLLSSSDSRFSWRASLLDTLIGK